jgi:ribosome biogenesis GTPase A
MGIFIHPSAYVLYDTNSRINSAAQAWPFVEKLHWFRQYALPDEKAIFWKQLELEDDDLNRAKFRILVCGDAGVGKSTLINLVLGTPHLVS